MAQPKSFKLENLLSGGGREYLAPAVPRMAWWGNTLLKVQAGKAVSGEKPEVLLKHSRYVTIYDWEKKATSWSTAFPGPVSDMDFCPVTRATAYNRAGNLYIMTAEGKELQLSTDGSDDIVYGQSVHRNEFGIEKGTFWSHDGKHLCFYRMDQSMVASYPLVDITTRIATTAPTKYPMAGEKSHKVSMGDNTDQYYPGITWGPDDKSLYLYNLNRGQNHLKLWQFDPQSGVLAKQVMEETNDKYIDPQNGIIFLPWDEDRFIYQAGDGYLYLHSLKNPNQVVKLSTPQMGVMVSILGFNAKKKSLIMCTTGCSPIQHNLFSLNIDKAKLTLLDNGEGVHKGLLSPDGSQVVDTWSSPQVVKQVDLLSTNTQNIQTLLSPSNPWKGYAVPEIVSGSIKAADGTTDLYYRMVKPVNFDPTKRYPTIVYVYGGPHTRLVQASYGYGYRGWEIYMAQKGYLVFVLDNRGSSERGVEFENVTFHHLGREEMKDQMKGVEYLRSLPYVDTDRLGVHGWSYGGFMTTNLMLTYPDVFKCAVAGGPVIDWSYYEVMYGERYMGRPQDNPEGYKENNLKLRAGNLKGRLEIIFGYQDPVCVPQHTLSFIRACETAGTHPDLFIYPGAEHNMTKRDQIHLHEHITRYFEDHLK